MKNSQFLLCTLVFAALFTTGAPAAAQVKPTPGATPKAGPEKTVPPAGVEPETAPPKLEKEEVEAEEELFTTAPVALDGVQLFSVRGIKAYPARKRAGAIVDRIEKLAQNRSISPGSVKTRESDLGTDILSGAGTIMTVVDADAEIEGVTRQQLASVYATKLRNAVQKYRQDRTPEKIRSDIRFAFLATVVLLASLLFVRRVYRALLAAAEARYKAKVHAVTIKTFELVRAERIWTAFKSALKALRFLTVLVLAYAWLYLVLDRFPWTRAVAGTLLSLALDPLRTIGKAVVGQIPNIVFLVILAFIVRYLLKLLGLFFSAVEKGNVVLSGFEPEWALPTYRIIRVLVLAFAVVVAYPYIPGSASPAFKGISIFLGVVVSLGSSSALSNIIAGYMMTYRRAFRAGDRVKIGDFTGDVTEMRLLVTHLRTVKNEEVVIPNSLILNSHVMNYSSLARERGGLILHTTVGIGYDTPWRQVNSLLLAAAERTPGLIREPPPFVLQRSLNAFDVTYEINAYTGDPRTMERTYSDLHRNIQDEFNSYGVQIMTPAYMSDPEQLKVVPKDQWYAAPAKPPGADETSKKNAA